MDIIGVFWDFEWLTMGNSRIDQSPQPCNQTKQHGFQPASVAHWNSVYKAFRHLILWSVHCAVWLKLFPNIIDLHSFPHRKTLHLNVNCLDGSNIAKNPARPRNQPSEGQWYLKAPTSHNNGIKTALVSTFKNNPPTVSKILDPPQKTLHK